MPFGIPSEDFHGGFDIPEEEEYESHDNLVCSSVEAGCEICKLRELLSRAYEQILLLGYGSTFTNEEVEKLMNDIREYYRRCACISSLWAITAQQHPGPKAACAAASVSLTAWQALPTRQREMA